MFAVGVDVSKGKSMVAVLETKVDVVFKPFEVLHTAEGLDSLVEKLKALKGEKRIVRKYSKIRCDSMID